MVNCRCHYRFGFAVQTKTLIFLDTILVGVSFSYHNAAAVNLHVVRRTCTLRFELPNVMHMMSCGA